ncbi:hypothetical protein AVEN_74252-1 [Araneus ventricosus]|uniref:Uncharacterized protein n=1 Tax=Araneus ventricosus TaxID=182803 RepID=A0A4Y2EVL7_ARAVE|nr:hypothetical protein AVEN_74252-1 [Araneus ventricosus]
MKVKRRLPWSPMPLQRPHGRTASGRFTRWLWSVEMAAKTVIAGAMRSRSVAAAAEPATPYKVGSQQKAGGTGECRRKKDKANCRRHVTVSIAPRRHQDSANGSNDGRRPARSLREMPPWYHKRLVKGEIFAKTYAMKYNTAVLRRKVRAADRRIL